MTFTCPSFSPEVIVKLTRRMWCYFDTLIDIDGMHVIECTRVHISNLTCFTVFLISTCA